MPVVLAVNKIDRLDHARTAAALAAAAELVPGAEVFPVSARTGAGVEPLVEHLVGLLPEGPFYFESDRRSDQPEEVELAELVREQVLRPHPRGGAARRRGPGRRDRPPRRA